MRLIDADKFAEDICNLSAIDEHSANAVIFLLHEQPTIDIKTEVAREIFAEIEKTIANLEYRANTPRKIIKVEELKAQVNWVLHEAVPQTLTELKNKYIGGVGNENSI